MVEGWGFVFMVVYEVFGEDEFILSGEVVNGFWVLWFGDSFG